MSQETGLRVMTLNASRFLKPQTHAFVRRLGADIPMPDVLLVQDVAQRDLSLFGEFTSKVFEPMTNHLVRGLRTPVGIAVLSQLATRDVVRFTYWGDGTLKDLEGVNIQGQREGADADELVLKTEDRVYIGATVTKGGQRYRVGTTHGFWTRGGQTTNDQIHSMARLARFIEARESRTDLPYIFGGDLNTNRGKEVYHFFTAVLEDYIPERVTTTLDPSHPVYGKFNVVTDYFMGRHLSPDGHMVTSDFAEYTDASDHESLAMTFNVQAWR